MAKKKAKRPKRKQSAKRPAKAVGVARVIELLEEIHLELCEVISRLDNLDEIAREAHEERLAQRLAKR